MSLPPRARGVKVLKAVSSPMRLNILNLLFDKGALSYTELMNHLKMHPSRDAGRFAYHLKFLLKANLVEVDSEAKKYFLTDLGKMVIDIADRVDKKALKPRGMLVRTSHSTLEEFDVNKIANSLIREAKMPPDQAQRMAKEAEKLLQKSKIKYLTSPLIREVVNAILIEKGQEEYRHKLTRLGMPVHEVAALIEAKDTQGATGMLFRAGEHIFTEYNLLNVLPRDIADAHSSGALHIDNLDTWLLRPNEVMHDLRFFLKNGVKTTNSLNLFLKPPQTFEAVLATILNVLLHSKEEFNDMQTCDHFNTFLAPFAKGVEPEKAKESLRLFLLNLNQNASTSLVIDITVPRVLSDKLAICPDDITVGKYGDFAEESSLLARLVIDVFSEESSSKPLLNPRLILRITNEDFANENAKELILKAHGLASEKGLVYFANAFQSDEKNTNFSSTGCKLETDPTGDWETETLRTGCIGTVTINLPRIAHESDKDTNKFFQILKERYELANRALEIKQRTLRQHARNSLPFLTQSTTGDAYFRLENCSGLINMAGLKETIETLFNQGLKEENMKFMEEIVQNTITLKQKISRKHGKRIFPTIICNREASERLGQLDIEKYGVAKVKFLGTRDKPYYSTSKRLQLEAGNVLSIQPQSLEFAQKLRSWNAGANLNIIELEQDSYKPEDIMNLTRQLIQTQTVELLTYNRKMTHCSNCRRSWIG
ncbi:MAG TPA: anaerobic ribonucleoside-triphosphate reductase, partial [Candidatus Bathyarchaeia archaeon]